jgi:hypothetical protein
MKHHKRASQHREDGEIRYCSPSVLGHSYLHTQWLRHSRWLLQFRRVTIEITPVVAGTFELEKGST